MTGKLDIIRKIHSSGYQAVLAVTGGGSGAISELLSVPGGSQFLLEAAVPYSFASASDLLHSKPEQFCSPQTAINLALWAYQRGIFLAGKEKEKELSSPEDLRRILGVGVTASLVSDRPKKGAHRVHIAIQTFERAFRFSLELEKGARSRFQEERRASDLILRVLDRFITENNLAKDSSSLLKEDLQTDSSQADLDISLFRGYQKKSIIGEDYLRESDILETSDWEPRLSGDQEESESIAAALPLAELLFSPSKEDGFQKALCYGQGKFKLMGPEDFDKEKPSPSDLLPALFSGSFNPIHRGHLKMIQLAEAHLGVPVDLEMAVVNADKPPIDFFSLKRRLEEIEKRLPHQKIWLTRFPLFVQKSEFFGPATFLMGIDTLARLIHPRYYRESLTDRDNVLKDFIARGERFLVFARPEGDRVRTLSQLEIPSFFCSICEEIPPALFTDDISSTILRKNGSFLI